jgi:glucokinase
MSNDYWLGVDLGGSSAKSAALRRNGEVVGQGREVFDPDKPLDFVEAVRRLVDGACSEWGKPAGVGLSAPGVASPRGDAIAVMPGRLAGLEGLVWRDALGLDHPVPVLNDAQAALFGEAAFGAARGVRHAILITLGTGVGGAIWSDGRLLRGHTGKGGHLGHLSLDPAGTPDICGTPGSLEDAIGNHNIRARSAGRFETTHALVAAHIAGDPFATSVWMTSVRALAAAIVSFGNVLDPEIVILGGGVAEAGEALFNPLRQYLDAMEWRPAGSGVTLRPAALGPHAGAWGAAACAMPPDA